MSAIVPVNGGIVPGVQQINTNLNVPGGGGGALKGFMGKLGNLSLALSAGEFLGNLYKNNTAESDFVSGRGSGAQALVGKDQRRKNTQAISETMAPVRELLGTQDLSTAAQPTTPGRDTAPPTSTPGIEQKGTQMGGTFASAAPARTPQSDDMDENFKIWAKANPTLAKKLKEGDYGYEAVQSVVNPPVDASSFLAPEGFPKFSAPVEAFNTDIYKNMPTDTVPFEVPEGTVETFSEKIPEGGIDLNLYQQPGEASQKASSLKDKYVQGVKAAREDKGNASFAQIPDFPVGYSSPPVKTDLIDTDLYKPGVFTAFGDNATAFPGLQINSYQSFEDWSRSNTNPFDIQ